MPTTMVTLFNNNNATAVGLARTWLETQFTNTSGDWWALENSYSVSTVRHVQLMVQLPVSLGESGECGSDLLQSRGRDAKFLFEVIDDCAKYYPGEATSNPLRLHDSKNIDTVRHTGCALGSATLAQ